jgi:predicted HicB family RNase H-like nuclease
MARITITTTIEKKLVIEAKVMAAREEKNLNDIIEEALTEHINLKNQQKGPN